LDLGKKIPVLNVRQPQAVKFLRDAGFQKVKNLTGGILAWVDKIDPEMVKY
jgi:adenylyltransferase/sulfurtransferase